MEKFEPYYVAIFTSKKTNSLDGYLEMDDHLMKLVKDQEGFLGIESFSNESGRDVSIVSFKTEKDMQGWKEQQDHSKAQSIGRTKWYEHYNVKICRVEREYEFNK